MFTVKPLKIKTEAADDPAALFLRDAASMRTAKRSVCFYRIIGTDLSDGGYAEMLRGIDAAAEKLPSAYARIGGLTPPPLFTAHRYIELSGKWIETRNAAPEDIMQLSLPLSFPDETVKWSVKRAFCLVLNAFAENNPAAETPFLNFAAKMLFWMDVYLRPVFTGGYFPKLVFTGGPKKHGVLFMYFCANIGCDVLYINPAADFPALYAGLPVSPLLCEKGARREITVPEYEKPAAPKAQKAKPAQPASPATTASPAMPVQTKNTPPPVISAPVSPQTEMTYEELAALSASVVMIGVFDKYKKRFATGSGVVISEGGYILTNSHVVEGGAFFSVQFENNNNEYFTDTVIKYHTTFDLAVIRVDKSEKPIELPASVKLARGQKIVAIGSPLGLFNTVSDGIISGFRNLNGTDMIQFTAPTSGGSSGGALINMYGKLVGIIQGGFEAGQNLNLAVAHNVIYGFARAFL